MKMDNAEMSTLKMDCGCEFNFKVPMHPVDRRYVMSYMLCDKHSKLLNKVKKDAD